MFSDRLMFNDDPIYLRNIEFKGGKQCFFPLFFGEAFEKKFTKPFELVANYFQISQKKMMLSKKKHKKTYI